MGRPLSAVYSGPSSAASMAARSSDVMRKAGAAWPVVAGTSCAGECCGIAAAAAAAVPAAAAAGTAGCCPPRPSSSRACRQRTMEERCSVPSDSAGLSGASCKAGCASTMHGHLPHCKHTAISSSGATLSWFAKRSTAHTPARCACGAPPWAPCPAARPSRGAPAHAADQQGQACSGGPAGAASGLLAPAPPCKFRKGGQACRQRWHDGTNTACQPRTVVKLACVGTADAVTKCYQMQARLAGEHSW